MHRIRRLRRFSLSRLAILVIGLGVLVGVLWLTVRAFRIRSIYVSGSPVGVTIDEKAFVTNLVFFPSAKLRREILSRYPLLSDVTITKDFPDTLRIHLSMRQPIAVMSVTSGQWVLDPDGFVLGIADQQRNLPVVFAASVSTFRVGQKVEDHGILQALRALSGTGDELTVTSLTLMDQDTIVMRAENADIYFPLVGDVRTKAATLQTLFAGFRIKGTLPATVDLRFDKPIVTFR